MYALEGGRAGGQWAKRVPKAFFCCWPGDLGGLAVCLGSLGQRSPKATGLAVNLLYCVQWGAVPPVLLQGMPKVVKNAKVACLDMDLQKARMHMGIQVSIGSIARASFDTGLC